MKKLALLLAIPVLAMGSTALGVGLPWQDDISYPDGPLGGHGSWDAAGPLQVSSSGDHGFATSHVVPDPEEAWNFHDFAVLDSRVDSGSLYFGFDSASINIGQRIDTLVRIIDGDKAAALAAFQIVGGGIAPSTAWDIYADEIAADSWTIFSHDVAVNVDAGSYRYTISDASGTRYDTGDTTAIIEGATTFTGVDGFRIWQWGTRSGPAHGGADDAIATALDNFYINSSGIDPFPLAALRADFDMDGDVDFNDFSILAGNFTGTLDPGVGGFGPDEGDTDGDEDVDFSDFSRLAADFTGTLTAPASDAASSGDVHLSIDMENDGAMTLEASNASLAGYSIRSSDSQLVPDADGAAAPFMFYLLNAGQEVTAGSVGAATTLTSDLLLDISFGGDADQAENVVFQYTRAGDVTPVDGVVHVIPEPATMMLLAASGLLLNRRRSA